MGKLQEARLQEAASASAFLKAVKLRSAEWDDPTKSTCERCAAYAFAHGTTTQEACWGCDCGDGVSICGCFHCSDHYDPSPIASCLKDDQCYNGGHASTACCTGHVIDDAIHCTESLTCQACKTASGWLVGQLAKQSCLALIPEGVVMCEVAGFGPEDPLADICAVIVGASCPAISSLVSSGMKDPVEVCEHLGYCTASGDGDTGRIFGTKCGCVAKGGCTANADGCCSGKAESWNSRCAFVGLMWCD